MAANVGFHHPAMEAEDSVMCINWSAGLQREKFSHIPATKSFLSKWRWGRQKVVEDGVYINILEALLGLDAV